MSLIKTLFFLEIYNLLFLYLGSILFNSSTIYYKHYKKKQIGMNIHLNKKITNIIYEIIVVPSLISGACCKQNSSYSACSLLHIPVTTRQPGEQEVAACSLQHASYSSSSSSSSLLQHPLNSDY